VPIEQNEPLNEQREWLRVTLASIGDAVITTDVEGRITFMNPVAQAVTGWRQEEAAGLALETVFNIVNEETRRTVENPAVKALREGVVVGLANHTLLISKDGTERPIDDSAAPIRNAKGEVAGVVLVFRDISERRQAERALQESEERFRLLVEGTRDYAIFMLDPQGRVVSWNSGAEHIKGYSADEIMGKDFSCFYSAEAREAGVPRQLLNRAAMEGRVENEGWRVRKDGSQFWADAVITALRDNSGRLRGFSKVTRDMTERHQLDQTKLAAEVLAELGRRKDEFLAMLSHELRNPLAAIHNGMELLRPLQSDDPLHQGAWGIVERQLHKLTKLVDELLDVSRVTSGTIQLQREHIDLRVIVEHALETARPQIVERRHELSVSLPSEVIWVLADAIRVEQVLVNLLTNAAKYTDAGGRIWLNLTGEDGTAVLRVRDNGAGIEPELLNNIFDLFAQSARSLDRSQGGLGVGLTVARRIVELHGGSIEAASAGLGQGSEFSVHLPTSSPPSSAAESASLPSTRVARLRVLVVDDNKDAADCVALLLRHAGHETQTAYSSYEALDLAAAFHPDAILLDLGLPEIDGYEVARRLRAKPEFSKVWLIALSGYGQESDRQRAREAGCDAHMLKPATLKQIEEELEALGKRRT
jgi:PAS domain S-box-containing protein